MFAQQYILNTFPRTSRPVLEMTRWEKIGSAGIAFGALDSYAIVCPGE
jgi:hypothetical protein